MNATVSYLASALVAGAIALFELRIRLQRRIPWRPAWWQLCVRFSVDALAGFIGYAVVVQLTKGVQWLPGVALIIFAGALGPAVWRSQALVAAQPKKSQVGAGLELLHRRIRDFIDGDVDGLASEAHARWRDNVVVPATFRNGMSYQDFGQWAIDRIRSLRLVSSSKKQRAVRAIDKTLRDAAAANDPDADVECRMLIVDCLDQNGGRRFLERLVKGV